MSERKDCMKTESVTRDLYDYQCGFHAQVAKKGTLERVVVTNLVGRVLALAVSMVLHAEAVVRAVAASFLTIKKIFSETDQELLKRHREEGSLAYSRSFISFLGVFYPSVIPQKQLEEEPPSVIAQNQLEEEPHYLDGSREIDSVGSLDKDLNIPGNAPSDSISGVSGRAASVQEEPVIVSNPVEDVVALSASPPSPDTGWEVASEREAHSPVQRPLSAVIVSPPYSPGRVSVNEHKSPAPAAKAPLSPGFDDFELVKPASAPTSPMHRSGREPGMSPKSPGNSSLSSAFSLVGARDPGMPTSPLAQPVDTLTIPYRQASIEDRDARFSLRAGSVDAGPTEQYVVGMAEFSSDNLKAETFSRNLELKIEGKAILAPLFGLFHPEGGPEAAHFLEQNIPATLAKHLSDLGKTELTLSTMWQAFATTFEELHAQFAQKHKGDPVTASATVSLILKDVLWVAQVGTTQAAINNAGEVVDMTLNKEISETARFSSENPVIPKLTKYDLEDVFPFSHLVIGNSGLFATSSMAQIVKWIKPVRGVAPLSLAHNVVYSTFIHNQLSKDKRVQERSLSALIVALSKPSVTY